MAQPVKIAIAAASVIVLLMAYSIIWIRRVYLALQRINEHNAKMMRRPNSYTKSGVKI